MDYERGTILISKDEKVHVECSGNQEGKMFSGCAIWIAQSHLDVYELNQLDASWSKESFLIVDARKNETTTYEMLEALRDRHQATASMLFKAKKYDEGCAYLQRAMGVGESIVIFLNNQK